MRRSSAMRWAPAAVLVAAAAIAGVAMLGDDEPGPVDVDSSAAEFDSLGELVAASDLVVVATVTEVDDGRTITAPDDPDAGIHTRLVRLDVREVLAGETAVGGRRRGGGDVRGRDRRSRSTGCRGSADGDVAIWFLVAGGSDAMPYFAAVNGQARFVVVGETLEPSGNDELSRALAALGVDGLADAVRTLGT